MLVAAVALLLAGCGSTQKAVEKATGCDVDTGNDQASLDCEDGKGSVSFGDSAKVPKGFPRDDVPLPDGKLLTAFATETDNEQGYNLAYTFKGSLEDAAEDYGDDLRDAGFTIDDSQALSASDAGFLGFSAENDGWNVTVIGAGAKSGDSGDRNAGLSVTVVATG